MAASERRINILASSWPFTFLPKSWWWWAFVAALLAAVIVYVSLRVREARKERARELEVGASDHEAPRRPRAWRVNKRDAETFKDALIHPSDRFLRITETVEPFTRSLLIRTTYVLRTDDLPRDREVIVPILLNARGHLENGVAFTDGELGRISSLNRDETVAYVLAVVWQLIVAAGPGAIVAYMSTRQGSSIKDRVRSLLESDQGRPADPVAAEVAAEGFRELLDDVLEPRFANPTRLYDICHLLTALRANHPICVPVGSQTSTDGARRITVERRVIPGVRASGADVSESAPASPASDASRGKAVVAVWRAAIRFARWSLDWLRRLAGVTPSVLTHELPNASRAASYHLSFAGPNGYYAARFRLVEESGRTIGASTMGARSARVSPLRGQRHAHLYLRGATRTTGVGFQVSFFERTPGSMAVALAAALATLAIASMIAISQVAAAVSVCDSVSDVAQCLGVDAARTGDNGTLLQILLTFPIALVAISFTKSSEVWGGVLVARVVNAAIVGLAIVALALSTFSSAFTPNGLSVAWITVIGAMLVVFVGSLASWAQRVLVHAAYIAQKV